MIYFVMRELFLNKMLHKLYKYLNRWRSKLWRKLKWLVFFWDTVYNDLYYAIRRYKELQCVNFYGLFVSFTRLNYTLFPLRDVSSTCRFQCRVIRRFHYSLLPFPCVTRRFLYTRFPTLSLLLFQIRLLSVRESNNFCGSVSAIRSPHTSVAGAIESHSLRHCVIVTNELCLFDRRVSLNR